MSKKEMFKNFFKDSQLFNDDIVLDEKDDEEKDLQSISELIKGDNTPAEEKTFHTFVSDVKNNLLNKEEKEETSHSTSKRVSTAFNKKSAVSSSHIAKDVKIIGNITCQGDLTIEGNVDGDIECYQCLTLSGDVKGNIKVSTLNIDNANITGDIQCEHDCVICDNTTINGNVTADSVTNGGIINGNITSQNRIVLKSSGTLNGDCKSKLISIEEGAAMKGTINTLD